MCESATETLTETFTQATTTLYRPVGQSELDLIAGGNFKSFPPRLAHQPIFYPVLNEEYAVQIARDWNAKHNLPPVGYVTRFQILTSYLNNFEVHTVGGSHHQEYWIPSGQLMNFNRAIIGSIEVIASFANDG